MRGGRSGVLGYHQRKGEQLERGGRRENGNHVCRNYFLGPDREQGGLGYRKNWGQNMRIIKWQAEFWLSSVYKENWLTFNFVFMGGEGEWWCLPNCYVAQFRLRIIWNASDKLHHESHLNTLPKSVLSSLVFIICFSCGKGACSHFIKTWNIAHSCIWTTLTLQRFRSFFLFL